MTQEEKARAYDEALEVMRQWIAPCHTKEQLDTLKKSVFPELAESEDERIRKALIEVFKKKLERGFEWVEYGIPNHSVLDWLEKQKETSIRWFKSDEVKNPDKPYIDKAGMFYTTDGRMCYASEIEKLKEEQGYVDTQAVINEYKNWGDGFAKLELSINEDDGFFEDWQEQDEIIVQIRKKQLSGESLKEKEYDNRRYKKYL